MKLSRLSKIAQIRTCLASAVCNLSGKDSMAAAQWAAFHLHELEQDLLDERERHIHEFHGGDATAEKRR